MSEGDRMNDADTFAIQLRAKIGRSVDQQVTFGKAQDDTAPTSLVTRVIAAADFTLTADRRDANGSTAPQHDQLPRKLDRLRLLFQLLVGFRFSQFRESAK